MSKITLKSFVFLNTVSCLIISLVGLSVYFSVLSHDFQSLWDDQWVAINRYTDNGITFLNLKRILLEFYHGQYAPVNQFYYSLIYHFFGYNAFVFHLGSVVFHALNALLIYFLVKKLATINEISKKQVNIISIVTAVLFVVHPLTVESVAWIAASKVVIYSFFYLSALVIYVYYLKNKHWTTLLLVTFFFILSFGAKEQAVTLPICLFLIDYLYKRDFRTRQVYLEKLPLLILALLFGYVTMMSQQVVGEGVLSDKSQYPLYQRLVFSSYSIIEYFTKGVVPLKLSYIYPFPMQIGESVPLRFWIYPPICFIVLYIVYKTFNNRVLIFWSSFFLIHLIVVLHVIPIGRFTITADRYAYISLIAICFGIAYLVINRWSVALWLRYGLLIMYFLLLCFYTTHRVKVWENTDTLKKEIRLIIENR